MVANILALANLMRFKRLVSLPPFVEQKEESANS
jgi:hypothetical protein